jgi:hypothetical protein
MAIKHESFGEHHEETAVTYGNLAGVLRRLGDLEEALELCQKALVIEEEVYGHDHPEVAITINNLAQVVYM